MPATATTSKVRHEEFCLPGEGRSEPRMEQFPVYREDEKSGLSRVSHTCTRCMDCGATHYEPKEK